MFNKMIKSCMVLKNNRNYGFTVTESVTVVTTVDILYTTNKANSHSLKHISKMTCII